MKVDSNMAYLFFEFNSQLRHSIFIELFKGHMEMKIKKRETRVTFNNNKMIILNYSSCKFRSANHYTIESVSLLDLTSTESIKIAFDIMQ